MEKELLLRTFKTELLKSNKSYCYSLISDAYNNGMTIKEIYIGVAVVKKY